MPMCQGFYEADNVSENVGSSLSFIPNTFATLAEGCKKTFTPRVMAICPEQKLQKPVPLELIST